MIQYNQPKEPKTMQTEQLYYKGYIIEVAQDEDAGNPFEEWDTEPPLSPKNKLSGLQLWRRLRRLEVRAHNAATAQCRAQPRMNPCRTNPNSTGLLPKPSNSLRKSSAN